MKRYYGIRNILQGNMKLSAPHIDKSDIRSIKNILKSEWISTSSKTVNKFEDKISNFCNTKHSIALNSGTSAIHLGLQKFWE